MAVISEKLALFVEKMAFDAVVPTRAYPTDSGLDLYAHNFKSANTTLCDTFDLKPGERVLVGTGIKATVGPGYEIQIRPRSGLALKKGLTVLNTPGTIDEQYRGEISVILANLSETSATITKGDRIAQMVVCPVVLLNPTLVERIPETDRSSGGFGSSGV